MNTWARVIDHKHLGEDLFRLRLNSPEIASAAKPGQFVMLKVRHGSDPLLARPFSIHGVEGDDLFILYRVVGRGTKILSLTKPDKNLALWGPLGAGFDLNVENPILVAGGIGRAPLAFAARVLEEQGKEVQWVYGGPDAAEIENLIPELKARLERVPCKTSMDDFRRFVDFKSGNTKEPPWDTKSIPIFAATEDGSEGHKGLVTSLLSDMLADTPSSFPVSLIACGPMPMLKAVAKLAAEHNRPCQASLEAPMACGIGVCLGCVIPRAGGGYLRACQEGPVLDAVKVDWNKM